MFLVLYRFSLSHLEKCHIYFRTCDTQDIKNDQFQKMSEIFWDKWHSEHQKIGDVESGPSIMWQETKPKWLRENSRDHLRQPDVVAVASILRQVTKPKIL